MAITYYEWLDYSQVKYTDNCICDIPMHDKNDLNDKVGIHNFNIIVYRPNDNRLESGKPEDCWDVKGYHDYLAMLKDNGSTTAIRNSATQIYEKMRGERVIYSNAQAPSHDLRLAWTQADENGEYGCISIPSLAGYSYGIGTLSTTSFPGCYCQSSSKYASDSHYVKLNVNPITLTDPKTGTLYKSITIKLDFFYINSHFFFVKYWAGGYNDAPVMANAMDKEYSRVKIQGEDMLLQGYLYYITSNGKDAHYSRADSATKSYGTSLYWHKLTYTDIKPDNLTSISGGKIIAYLDDSNIKTSIVLDKVTNQYYTGLSTSKYTNAEPLFNMNEKGFALSSIDNSGNTSKASYNKNFIRNLQIFNGEDYNEIATEPMSFINMNEDKKLYRVVTNNNELKKKSYRCYEYR